MIYRDFKDLLRRIASDKLLRDKTFDLAKIQNMGDMCMELLQWFTNLLDKFSPTQKWTGINSENQQLGDESRKPVIKKFKKHQALVNMYLFYFFEFRKRYYHCWRFWKNAR